jgi:hypothetical protein
MLVDLWVDQTRITRESQHATVITNMDVSIQGYWVLSPNVLGYVSPMIWVVVFSVLKFLHPAADCHLHQLPATALPRQTQEQGNISDTRTCKFWFQPKNWVNVCTNQRPYKIPLDMTNEIIGQKILMEL